MTYSISDAAQLRNSNTRSIGTNPLDRSAKPPLNVLQGRRLRASDKAGNTLAKATFLDEFPGKRTFKDNVSRRDPDFLEFSVAEGNNATITFQNRSNATLSGAILNAQGQVVNVGSDPQTGNFAPGEQTSFSYAGIPAGTYYVRVRTNAQGKQSYRLTVDIQPPGSSDPTLPPCGCGT